MQRPYLVNGDLQKRQKHVPSRSLVPELYLRNPSLPNSVWERHCLGNSVSCAAAKLSFAGKRDPKQSLGTRGELKGDKHENICAGQRSPLPTDMPEVSPPPNLATTAALYTRSNPFPGKLAVNRRLSGPESEKDTRHFEVDLTGWGLTFEVGDSMAVYPTNDP